MGCNNSNDGLVFTCGCRKRTLNIIYIICITVYTNANDRSISSYAGVSIFSSLKNQNAVKPPTAHQQPLRNWILPHQGCHTNRVSCPEMFRDRSMNSYGRWSTSRRGFRRRMCYGSLSEGPLNHELQSNAILRCNDKSCTAGVRGQTDPSDRTKWKTTSTTRR